MIATYVPGVTPVSILPVISPLVASILSPLGRPPVVGLVSVVLVTV